MKCNIHPWMHGNFAVLKNSHYSVLKRVGAFTISNLPPGKYTISAWQESYGERPRTSPSPVQKQRPLRSYSKPSPIDKGLVFPLGSAS